VEIRPLSIPYPKPRRFGRHVLTAGDNILVRVHSTDGHVGIGESISRPYVYGESMPSICHAILEWFGPSIEGMSVFDTDAMWRAWDLVAANYAAKAGLDMAIHDIQAQVVGLPLWRWYGGEQRRIPLSWILTYGDPGAIAEEALAWSERGYGSFKVKISADPAHDREVLSRLRDELPEATRFYADANGVLSRADFVARADELVDFGIELLEDPVATAAVGTRRTVWASSPIPILADETAKNVGEAAVEVETGGVDAFSLKIFRTGIHRSQEIATIARAFSRECLIGGQGETQVGSIIAAHYASGLAAQGFDRYPAETSSSYRFAFDLIGDGARAVGGAVELTDDLGSGITLDDDVVEGLATDTWRHCASGRKGGDAS
jgi:L-alanine-DL-glutamate epimerase-like enolase superfamily enzyme